MLCSSLLPVFSELLILAVFLIAESLEPVWIAMCIRMICLCIRMICLCIRMNDVCIYHSVIQELIAEEFHDFHRSQK